MQINIFDEAFVETKPFVFFLMDSLKKHFPQLDDLMLEKFIAMQALYRSWNEKINVISRKDMDFFVQRHLLHSLSILKVIRFRPGAVIMDAGTGGGFPGLPLAVACPEAGFVLVDSVGKKIKVINDIVSQLGISNVKAVKSRVEDMPGKYDFVTSRAVKPLPVFYPWVRDKIRKESQHPIPNGILYLKGGDLQNELEALPCKHKEYKIADFIPEPFFETKKIVHLFDLK